MYRHIRRPRRQAGPPGAVNFETIGWLSAVSLSCSAPYRIYCIEAG